MDLANALLESRRQDCLKNMIDAGQSGSFNFDKLGFVLLDHHNGAKRLFNVVAQAYEKREHHHSLTW